MKIIAILVIIYIVPIVLSRLSDKTKLNNTDSTEHFVMRPVKDLAKIGYFVAGFFGFCMYGSYIAEQFYGFIAVTFTGFFLLGMLLVFVPIAGFWDVTVNSDDVTSSIMWIFRKTIRISDIDYCTIKKGGINIYVRGRKAMSIDSMCNNTENWLRRMEKEGIEVRQAE